MAGKIVADTLEHSTAGAIATNYVVEGSAKALVDFDCSDGVIDKSLNISGIVDNSVGNFTISLSSSLDSADYHFISGHVASEGETATINASTLFGQHDGTVRSASSITCEAHYTNSGNSRVAYDADNCDAVWFGDLA